MGWGVQALWFNTWYDVSIGPNLELFNHARKVGNTAEVRDNQYTIIAPVVHCAYQRLGPDTVVGERPMGDTSFEVDGAVRSEEHTSELQSLMRISYAVFCLNKKTRIPDNYITTKIQKKET